MEVAISVILVVVWFGLCNGWMHLRLHSTGLTQMRTFHSPKSSLYLRSSSLCNPFRRLRSTSVKNMIDDQTLQVNVENDVETSLNSTIAISARLIIDECNNESLSRGCESAEEIIINNDQETSGGIDDCTNATLTESFLEPESPVSEVESIETEDDDNEEIVITEDSSLPQSSIELFCDLYDDISTLQEQREQQLSHDASQSRLFRDHHAGLWTGIYEVFIPTFVTTTVGDEAVSEQLILRKWQSGAVQTTIVAGMAEDYLPEDNAQDVAATEIYTPLFTANPASFEMTSSLTCQPSQHQQTSGSHSFTCTPTTSSPSDFTADDTSSTDPTAEEPEQETQSLNMLQVTGFTPQDVTSELCRATQTAYHPSSLRAIRGNQCVRNALTVSRFVEGSSSNGLLMPSAAIIEPIKCIEIENEVTSEGMSEEEQKRTNLETSNQTESVVEEPLTSEEQLSNEISEDHEDEGEEEEIVIGEDEQVVVMEKKIEPSENNNVDTIYSSEEISESSSTLIDSPSDPQQEESENTNKITDSAVISEECVSNSIVPKVYVTELAVREDSLRTRVRFLYAPKRFAFDSKESKEEKSQEEDKSSQDPSEDLYDLYLVAFVVLREVAVSQLGEDGKIPVISPQELPYDRDQPGKSVYHIPFPALTTLHSAENATLLENCKSSMTNMTVSHVMSADYIEIALPGKLSLLFPRGVKEGLNASLTMQWTGEIRPEPCSVHMTSVVEEHNNEAVPAVLPKQFTYQIDRYFSTLQNAAVDALEVSEVVETIP